MNQTAYQGIRDMLEETYATQGWQIPQYIIDYQTNILASFMDRPDWQPEPSYAERYMTIRNANEAVNLGNVCWFTRAVFPELKRHRGITHRYYTELGQGCYAMALKHTVTPTIRMMRDHFEFLAEAAHTAIRYNNGFREMWDL